MLEFFHLHHQRYMLLPPVLFLPLLPLFRGSSNCRHQKFSVELEKSGGFLTQRALVFRQQNRTFSSDSAKVSFMVELLMGQALKWAQVVLKTDGEEQAMQLGPATLSHSNRGRRLLAGECFCCGKRGH